MELKNCVVSENMYIKNLINFAELNFAIKEKLN